MSFVNCKGMIVLLEKNQLSLILIINNNNVIDPIFKGTLQSIWQIKMYFSFLYFGRKTQKLTNEFE